MYYCRPNKTHSCIMLEWKLWQYRGLKVLGDMESVVFVGSVIHSLNKRWVSHLWNIEEMENCFRTISTMTKKKKNTDQITRMF